MWTKSWLYSVQANDNEKAQNHSMDKYCPIERGFLCFGKRHFGKCRAYVRDTKFDVHFNIAFIQLKQQWNSVHDVVCCSRGCMWKTSRLIVIKIYVHVYVVIAFCSVSVKRKIIQRTAVWLLTKNLVVQYFCRGVYLCHV